MLKLYEVLPYQKFILLFDSQATVHRRAEMEQFLCSNSTADSFNLSAVDLIRRLPWSWDTHWMLSSANDHTKQHEQEHYFTYSYATL